MSRVLAKRRLVRHPDAACPAAELAGAKLSLLGDRLLMIEYVVVGRVADLIVPPLTVPRRAEGLWRHTCFEAFVRTCDEQAYLEYNFAPSRQWAAYRFDEYRTGMRDAAQDPAPKIEVSKETHRLAATVTLDLTAHLPAGMPARLGLSAVLEGRDGVRSFWALNHPAGDPDFHHPACFALELPAAASA